MVTPQLSEGSSPGRSRALKVKLQLSQGLSKKFEPEPWLQFSGPFQKVNPKPGSSLSHSGPGPPSAQKVEKSWKTLIWCLPLFWVKWLKPIIHILLWWNFFELSCRMKSKKIHIKVETHLEAYFLRLFISCLGTSPHRCEQCFSLLWNMNDENNQI